jgi:hypothetical protein
VSASIAVIVGVSCDDPVTNMVGRKDFSIGLVLWYLYLTEATT